MNDNGHIRRLESIPIATIRASNLQWNDTEDFVAVFIGGTNGIGLRTARELFKQMKQPRAYLIGRNEKRGNIACRDLHSINDDGQAIFMRRDVSLIRNVDDLCTEICARETSINCLFLTAGCLSLGDRDESIEGIDKSMAVDYYSRMRCIINLMPLLDAAGRANKLSRVITVLAAGSEHDIIRVDDLDLKLKWQLHECLAHCAIMTNFMIEGLASRYTHTTFCHTYPGAVKPGVTDKSTPAVRLAAKVLYATTSSWLLEVEDDGERHFFQITSKLFGSVHNSAGVPVPAGVLLVRGMNGQPRSGAYLLDWDCRPVGDERTINKYRAMNFGTTVWEHTLQIIEQAVRGSRNDGKRPAHDKPDGSETRPAADPAGWRTQGTLRTRGTSNPSGWRPA